MTDFSGLRKELYRRTKNSGGRRDREYYESLYNYIVGVDTPTAGFSRRLIDLIILNDNLQMDAPGLDYFMSYFSQDPVYDRYFIDFIRSRGIAITSEPDTHYYPKRNSENVFLSAWRHLQLELHPPPPLPWKFNAEKYGFFNNQGILIIQFLFYGDPSSSGSGESGGLATLIGELGDALSNSKEIAGVITVAVDNSEKTDNAPYRSPAIINNKHVLAKLTLPHHADSGSDYTRFQARIENEIQAFISALSIFDSGIKKIFHVRYLDSASYAASVTASKLGIPLCATLTPDPHRKISYRTDETGDKDFHERLANFHRVLIGDLIVELSQGILGIGKKSIENVLLSYYPDLENCEGKEITGIDEGINLPEQKLKAATITLPGEVWKEKPLILNVGRLNRSKGQLNLIRAYNEFSIWKTHNLLIIGGNFEGPTGIEKEIISEINLYIKNNPVLASCVSFQNAQPNKTIRKFQQDLQERPEMDFPDVYLCSSLKEEFGLSILEAMSSGMIVLAPLSGGAGEYIRHGINGFLIDTSSASAIGAEFETYLYRRRLSPESLSALKANAEKTIYRNYSLEKITQEFILFYKKLITK